MIETLENLLQIVVLLTCSGVSLYRAVKYHSRTWLLALFFFGSWALGDIYWIICLIFYAATPQISIVSDLSWYAAGLFLYLILIRTYPPEDIVTEGGRSLIPWIGPAFAIAMAVFYMQWGEILSNTIYAGLMGLLLYASLSRLTDRDHRPGKRFLPAVILMSCLTEYALWTSSCFWSSDTFSNPYYWFDLILTLTFLLFIPAIRKAVTA